MPKKGKFIQTSRQRRSEQTIRASARKPKAKSRGLFIVIEGLDGSGATTQVRLLVDYLRLRGVEAYATKEPTDNVIGGLLRGALSGVYQLPSSVIQLLFSADRGHHLEKFIKPILNNGAWVVSDRYMWSTVAFGGVDLDREWLLTLQKYFPLPDATFLLKVNPEVCIERIKRDRHDFELYEELAKLKNVWKNYEWLAKKFKNQVTVIDGGRGESEVFSDIARELESWINRKEKNRK